MSRRFESAAAFRQALEARLEQWASERGTPLNTLRQMVVMERLIARLFGEARGPWLLKGGYAMELRLRPRARTTRDLDLSSDVAAGVSGDARREAVLDALREASEVDVDDHLVFRVHGPGQAVTGAPGGGWRFRVESLLAGKPYGSFHVDVGLDEPVPGTPERLVGEDYLGFAGIPPAQVFAIPRAVQFAEKIHAYTRPWGDRTNTRTKDFVDLLLLIEAGLPADEALLDALRRTFAAAASHELPVTLARPPEDWQDDFDEMAGSTGLGTRGLEEGFVALAGFWDRLGFGGEEGRRR